MTDVLADAGAAPRLGLTFVPWDRPPEDLPAFARLVEDSGLDTLWLWEDCFAQSGLACAATALAGTSRIRVGVALLPTPLRNVALTAMELATLARLYPGRLLPGIGHGVQDWMAQAGAKVASPMTLLREYAVALRALLAGEEVTVSGRYVKLDRVRLRYPPTEPLPLLMGGFGEKTLRLSAELADGVLLARGGAEAVGRMRGVLDETGSRAGIVLGIGPEEGANIPGVAEAIAAAARAGATDITVEPAPDEPDLPGLIEAVRAAGGHAGETITT